MLIKMQQNLFNYPSHKVLYNIHKVHANIPKNHFLSFCFLTCMWFLYSNFLYNLFTSLVFDFVLILMYENKYFLYLFKIVSNEPKPKQTHR